MTRSTALTISIYPSSSDSIIFVCISISFFFDPRRTIQFLVDYMGRSRENKEEQVE